LKTLSEISKKMSKIIRKADEEAAEELAHIAVQFGVENDQKAIDNELKGLKKANLGGGELTTRLKKQILSINGNYEAKTVRDFVDNFLIAKDSIELRLFIAEITPDVDMSVDITLASGKEVLGLDLPMTGEFFFPGSGV
jgi:hypothetical protein